MNKQWRLTLVRSPIGRRPNHRATVQCLGLHRLQQTVVVPDNSAMRGMIRCVEYLLHVEEISCT